EAMPQLYASNQIDIGRSIQSGSYEAIRVQNPALVSWNEEGPVWGAPDGCTFALTFNTQKAPFDDAEVRRAVNFAIDRDQISNLAFEGSMPKAILPFSSYQGMLDYVSKIEEEVGATELGTPSPEKVDALMTEAGFSKNGSGVW